MAATLVRLVPVEMKVLLILKQYNTFHIKNSIFAINAGHNFY